MDPSELKLFLELAKAAQVDAQRAGGSMGFQPWQPGPNFNPSFFSSQSPIADALLQQWMGEPAPQDPSRGPEAILYDRGPTPLLTNIGTSLPREGEVTRSGLMKEPATGNLFVPGGGAVEPPRATFQELTAVAKSGLPEELKIRLLSKMTGLPLRDPLDVAAEKNTMLQDRQMALQTQRDEELFRRQEESLKSAEKRTERTTKSAEQRAGAAQSAKAQQEELKAQRDFVRDLLKSQAQGIDPKKYQLAQETVALAQAQGASPEQLREIAAGFGFEFLGAQPSAARSVLSNLGVMSPVSPSDVLLRPRGNPLQQVLQSTKDLPEAVSRVTGLVPGKAPVPEAPSKTAATEERVVVEDKDGSRFSLPLRQLPQALKQGYQQVQ